ncbi:MAG: RIP metalloprotease RseP [Myxococcota bacterium]
MAFTVETSTEPDSPQRTVDVPVVGSLPELGVISATVLVGQVVEGMPAEAAGLEPGDLILEVEGRPVGSFLNFADTVRTSGGRALNIVYARDGQVTSVDVKPVVRQVDGPFEIDGMEEEIYQVGIAHAMATLPGTMGLDRERNPLVSFPRAVSMTADNVGLLLRGLGKLLTGEVGADQLRGPITIAQVARKSLDMGWQAYLAMMIFISINLALVNLLPIPILDGGQLMIYVIEGVKRSPLSVQTREWVYQFGFIIIVMMMGLAFWNDLSGQWSKLIDWLGSEL